MLNAVNIAKTNLWNSAYATKSKYTLTQMAIDALNDSAGISTCSANYDSVNKSVKIVTGSSCTVSQIAINSLAGLGGTVTKDAQSFKVSSTSPITKIKLKMATTHANNGVVDVRLETDNAGYPSGTLCGTNTKKDGIAISATASAEYEVVLDAAFTPTINTTYHIVVVWVSGSGTLLFGCSSGNVYADGVRTYYDSGSWATDSNFDLYFCIYQSTVSDGIVIWASDTATAVPTQAYIVSDATLGTGSITYYFSRDGGTTFTACTLDTLVNISGQPSGTTIVAKAVITGNAELNALGWGWK